MVWTCTKPTTQHHERTQVRHLARSQQKPRRSLQQRETQMNTPDPSDEPDLFAALSAISITGPDSDGLLWVSFKTEDEGIGALSIQAESVAGRAVLRWRDMQS